MHVVRNHADAKDTSPADPGGVFRWGLYMMTLEQFAGKYYEKSLISGALADWSDGLVRQDAIRRGLAMKEGPDGRVSLPRPKPFSVSE